MKIFEYPFIIISIFVICVIVLGFIGILFAIIGAKTASQNVTKEFSSVGKLENIYLKLVRSRENVSVLYIDLTLDNVRSVYSDTLAKQVFSEIKPCLLNAFSLDNLSEIAIYDFKNFVAVSPHNENILETYVSACVAEINKCLLKHKALNLVNVNFGLYSSQASGITFTGAVNRAKQACTIAKKDKTILAKWDNLGGKQLEKRIKIENNIEKEIDNNSFFLEYQPIISAKTKKIIGAEVLSRLKGENGQVLTPGSFLNAVTSVGLTEKFDFYIFEKNCKWISNNLKVRGKYRYATNFARSTLCNRTFPDKIISIVDKYGLDFSSLVFEVLEDEKITAEERNQLAENFLVLREKGATIFLDDFGSGYTTFSDLQTLSVNTVKIDKSIINNIYTEKGILILKNLIKTANDLGFETVCEGIENEDHEKAAIEAGCDYLQGYYYYRPLPVATLEKLLDDDK